MAKADGWTWLQWIGQGLYAVAYYSTVAVVVTAVYGAKGTKAAAPHVAQAARWTGRNSKAGADKLQARLRGRKFATKPAKPEKAGEQKPPAVPAQRPQQGKSGSGQERGATAKAPRDSGAHTVGPPAQAAQQAGSSTSATSPSSGGSDMELFRKIKQAMRPMSQMQPATAWELDFHFQAYADMLLYQAELLSMYAETLDRYVGIDPRITRQYLEAVADVTSATQKLHRTRRQYRQLYRAAFEAAEKGRVRMPSLAGFWSTKNGDKAGK